MLENGRLRGGCLLGLCLTSLLFIVGGTNRSPIGQVRVSVTTAKQQGPIQVLGFKRPQSIHEDPLVHLRNVSSVQAIHVWMEILARGPSGLYTSRGSPGTQAMSADRVIPRGGEVWVHESALKSFGLFEPAKPIPACLELQPLISRVDFADGTKWYMDPHDREDVLSSPFPVGQGDCDNSAIAAAEWARFKGPGFRDNGTWKAPDADEVDAYSYTCTLERFNSDLGVMCPY